MVKVEPMNSSGFSFFSLARPARSFTSREICVTALRSALRTTGVMRPSGMATATPMWTSAWVVILSPPQEELTMGKRVRALAQALMTRSLNETLTFSPFSSCSRRPTAASMSISTVT